jgi:hypothetical protein
MLGDIQVHWTSTRHEIIESVEMHQQPQHLSDITCQHQPAITNFLFLLMLSFTLEIGNVVMKTIYCFTIHIHKLLKSNKHIALQLPCHQSPNLQIQNSRCQLANECLLPVVLMQLGLPGVLSEVKMFKILFASMPNVIST